MFFSKKGFSENYDKVLYDFKIESISGEIIDLNKSADLPFFYKDQYVLVYYGEIYNYLELKL